MMACVLKLKSLDTKRDLNIRYHLYKKTFEKIQVIYNTKKTVEAKHLCNDFFVGLKHYLETLNAVQNEGVVRSTLHVLDYLGLMSHPIFKRYTSALEQQHQSLKGQLLRSPTA